jgi:hypothetical protein
VPIPDWLVILTGLAAGGALAVFVACVASALINREDIQL